MAEKIVLIDGHSILNRAFYGVPDLTNAEGLHTNAIYGFLNIMFKILEEEKPEYLTVAFDVHAPTFRHEMFEEYKGTRKPMADELRQQVPVIKEVLTAMGVKIIEQAGLEVPLMSGDNSGEFIKWWIAQEDYDTLSMRCAPCCASAALWTAISILNGEDVPKTLPLALSVITREEADQYADLEAGVIAGADWTYDQVMDEIIVPARD